MRGSAVIFSAYLFLNVRCMHLFKKYYYITRKYFNNHVFLTGCVRPNIVFLISILTSLISNIAIYTSDKY